jgi:hypothetical protein
MFAFSLFFMGVKLGLYHKGRMRWTEPLTRIKKDGKCSISVRKPEVKKPLGNLGVDGRIILKWVLKDFGARVWTEFS